MVSIMHIILNQTSARALARDLGFVKPVGGVLGYWVMFIRLIDLGLDSVHIRY